MVWTPEEIEKRKAEIAAPGLWPSLVCGREPSCRRDSEDWRARPGAYAVRFADRIWFAHLRNVAKDADGSFMEAEHLGGDTDMVALVDALLKEEARRRQAGWPNWRIPMRPDHGHEILDDIGRGSHPGYPAIRRLRGLAELRGVMTALEHAAQKWNPVFHSMR